MGFHFGRVPTPTYEEAEGDATEKAYCDEEMGKTETKESDLEDAVSKLTAEIDQAAATSADATSATTVTETTPT